MPIRTLKDTDDKKEKNKKESFYAGAGQQIVGGPSKKKKGSDVVKDILEKVEEAGAEKVDPETRNKSASPDSKNFGGKGFKLGSSQQEPSEVVEAEKKEENAAKKYSIKLWKNGFSINKDGELRLYQDAANKEFLESIMSGKIPSEFIQEDQTEEVHVDIEDHKEEDYKQIIETPKMKPFSGAGNVLGDESSQNLNVATSSAEKMSICMDEKAQQELKLDEGQSIAVVQVRFPDGKSIRAKLNHFHTITDLKKFVSTARPDLRNNPYALRTTYPPKELDEHNQTIKDAGIIGATVLVRLK